jgi:N,N'-diacetyllegionaminate synthase
MNRVIVIAEAGVNHNGDMALAKGLIDAAANAGADYVKFQTFITELNISQSAAKAEYQINNTGSSETQFEMVKKLELSFENFTELASYAGEKGIKFLSTAFDQPSIDFLQKLSLDFFKIPSGEITNLPFLRSIGRLKSKVILSTGMCVIPEISEAINTLIAEGTRKEDITVLHCTTDYPTAMEDVHLDAMLTLRNELGTEVGYSDHTIGIEIPIAATALGARVIEKHFTLDRSLPGPDHAASLEPDELKAMVMAIRNIELAITEEGIKQPTATEKKNMLIARKSVHLAHALEIGHKLCSEDLVMMRPGDGISPMKYDQLLGLSIKTALPKHHKLSWEDVN